MIYIINSDNDRARVKFVVTLAKDLAKASKTILISNKRNDENIEDYFGMDGIIAYDIYDYFMGRIDLEDLIVKTEEAHFIIGPLLDDKFSPSEEDFNKLVADLSYENIIIESLEPNYFKEKKSLRIVEGDSMPADIKEEYFYILGDPDFDDRRMKEKIESYGKKYLGAYKAPGDTIELARSLVRGDAKTVAKIGFFEKLKMKFS